MNEATLEDTQLGQDPNIFAIVQGKAILELPKDLYIPPDALRVFLEAFEGPLDLLLYLIRKQNLNILDIPIAVITTQYMDYVELMKEIDLSLAAEYLVMAATLAEIKSRLLLPREMKALEEEEDPRAELIRRLQEYERFKQAAEDIDSLPRLHRDTFTVCNGTEALQIEKPQPIVELKELLLAFSEILKRSELMTSHSVTREVLSVRERMTHILNQLTECEFLPFIRLFTHKEGRMGVVVSLLAILELIKHNVIEFVQTELYAPIHIKRII